MGGVCEPQSAKGSRREIENQTSGLDKFKFKADHPILVDCSEK